jgi:plastocyanin
VTSTASDRMRRRLPALFPLALAVAALAGCGSSSNSNTTSSAPAAATGTGTTAAAPAVGEKLALEANPQGQLKYDKTSLTAKSPTVTVEFTNKAELAHNVTIESSSGSIVGKTPTFSGGTKPLTLSLKPGSYKFFCSVPGHRMAGMEGTLTVP